MPARERRLSKYDSMRDFTKSPEPPGKVAGSADGRNRFLVQRHRARRLHYDLRFEVDGVLVSWAVPKGPSLDPARKSLAVKVEDHPYAYGWFEGIIPSGYGMGDVVLWDDGWWEPDPEYPDEPPAAKAIEGGEFKFVLIGRKLRGRFLLVRTGKQGADDDQWLLMHKKDDAAVPGWDPEDFPRSVLSVRTNEDIAKGQPGRWPAATDGELAALRKLPAAKADWTVGGITQQITNLDKVLMPGRGTAKPITKREIIAYYATVAPWMTTALAGHPINLNRFPDGIDSAKGGFYHKAVPAHAPLWVRRWPNPRASTGETREYLLIDGAPALVWAANFAGFEIHPWTSTAASPRRALVRPRRHRPRDGDDVGRHADDRQAVPRRPRQARPRRPAEGHRASAASRSTSRSRPGTRSGRRRTSSRRCHGPSVAWCARWSAGNGRRTPAAARPASTTRRTR